MERVERASQPRTPFRGRAWLASVLVSLGIALPALAVQDEGPLAPTAEQAQETRQVAKQLPRSHYLGLPVDDRLSERLLELYLDFLDPSRAYLTAADVATFEAYSDALDDAVKSGDLAPAFDIFNRFQSLRIARLGRLIQAVRDDVPTMSFETDERLDFERSEAPWASSAQELDEFWRQRLKAEVLDLLLAERTREEAQELLLRRYENLLSQVHKIRADDVFQFFMNSFASSYDPHTQYLARRFSENFDVQMSLSLEGIGAVLVPDGEYTQVERLVHAGPAEKAGELQAGDRIVAVAQGAEGEFLDVVGWRVDDVVDLIRGPRETVVRLRILPADAPEGTPPRTISIVREEVKLEEQAARKEIVELASTGARPLRLGVIELPTFYMDFAAYGRGDPDFKSSTRDVERLLRELQDEGVDGILLDLRVNGGGSLIEAHELSGLFLGRRPVVQVREASGDVQVLGGDRPAAYPGPLVVLVDRLSASASEIFAAAIQDYGRGVVCGEPTFGKGTVQSIMPTETGRLLVTVAKFYRITGLSTQHLGVTPDVLFPLLHDPEEIGEETLDHALLGDRIAPLDVPRATTIPGFLGELRAAHERRAKSDPDLLRLQQELALAQEFQARETISLQEAKRREDAANYERRRKEIRTAWRQARGEPAEPEESEDESKPPRFDAPRQEALHVLGDLVLRLTPKLADTR